MLKILLFSIHLLPFCSAVPLLEERDVGRGLIGRMFCDPKCIYCQKNISFFSESDLSFTNRTKSLLFYFQVFSPAFIFFSVSS